jgi:hypothetical protein
MMNQDAIPNVLARPYAPGYETSAEFEARMKIVDAEGAVYGAVLALERAAQDIKGAAAVLRGAPAWRGLDLAVLVQAAARVEGAARDIDALPEVRAF